MLFIPGQDGGDGATGSTGTDGRDGHPKKPDEGWAWANSGFKSSENLKAFSTGTRGEAGRAGGNGGNGGLGGEGGNSGEIELQIVAGQEKITCSNSDGVCGSDGKSGNGGEGGFGGRNGNDAAWAWEVKPKWKFAISGEWIYRSGDLSLDTQWGGLFGDVVHGYKIIVRHPGANVKTNI